MNVLETMTREELQRELEIICKEMDNPNLCYSEWKAMLSACNAIKRRLKEEF